ncbi:MAG: hypothetical protein A2Y61_06720 [Chloroflexi bacterium RBG_13_60_13]|nr:MAG: hypothetical protein A2Y61_06720 [Chloroflexi bacterium RBG_13_60_13]
MIPTTAALPIPEVEVPEKARRRSFTAEYKRRILKEADACRKPGEIGALLRREGLYSSHLAWRNTSVDEGGIGAINFPLVADLTKQIARDYGILSGESVALRGTFLIDRKGIVRHQIVNDLGLGRNIDDVLRTLDALQHTER